MIGRKEMNLIMTGKKLVGKYKKNFSKFTDGDFFVRIILVDENDSFAKGLEYIVNADNLMDYLTNDVDFGNYKVDKIIFSKSGK